VLRRPTVLPVPAFALRLLLGEVADEMLLASTRGREPGA
jgi:NAD dependent epimerase/dehydratase family enzyme